MVTHYNDVTMGEITSQITSLKIVYSTVYSDADERKHQSSASLAFVWGIHRWPVNSTHKWPVTRKNVSIWWRHHVLQSYHSHLHERVRRCFNENKTFTLHCSNNKFAQFLHPHVCRRDAKFVQIIRKQHCIFHNFALVSYHPQLAI